MAKKPVKQEQRFQKQEEHAIQLGFQEIKSNKAGVDAIHPKLPGIEFHLYTTPGADKETPEGQETNAVTAQDIKRNMFFHVTRDKLTIIPTGEQLHFTSPKQLRILAEIMENAHELLKKQ